VPANIADRLDLAWSDVALEVALWALVRGETQPALDLLGASHGEPEARELYVETLGAAGQERLAELRQVVDRDPEDVDRWLLLGAALANAAWTARGAGLADMTTEDQFDGLADLTGQARGALRQASSLAPADAAPLSALLSCAQALPEQPGEHQVLFARVSSLQPQLYGAYHTMLRVLTRKWYGSQRQVAEFAREHTAALPDGHPLHSLTAHVHVEGYLDAAIAGSYVGRIWRFSRYFKASGVRAELLAGSDRLLASDSYARHPRFMAAHQAFAMIFHHAEDEQRSAPHLVRGGARPARWLWSYFNDPGTEFTAARRAAGLPT
jgi:hypothetical protein